MASQTRNAPRSALLPPAAAAFLRRRLIESVGIVLGLVGLALAIALASYDPADPSLNAAGPGGTHNLMGPTGAIIADILMQSIGLVATLLPAVLIAWAWRLASHRGLGRVWLRLATLPLALLGTAIAFAELPRLHFWPLASGLGGVTGDMLLARLVAVMPAGSGIGAVAIAASAGFVAVAAMVTALGFSIAEWGVFGRCVLWLGARGARAGAEGGRAGLRFGLWSWRVARQHGTDMAKRRDPVLRREGADAKAKEAESKGTERRREPTLRAAEPRAGSASARADSKESKKVELVAPKRARPQPGRRAEAARQAALDLAADEDYQLPGLELLEAHEVDGDASLLDKEALAENARLLESVLADFGVQGDVVKVRPGPVVTLYEFEPAPGTKSSRIIGLSDDIARSMSAVSVRVAVIPGRNVMGIELPNARREIVSLRELLAADSYERTASKLTLVLGKDIGGSPVIADLARMPHLLIAGTTGSGKSVAINTMILSLLFRLSPDQCRFVMIDPKMLELSVYDGIPHLLAPVVTDPKKAVVALKWTVREMENRYRLMSTLGVRNIAGYNARLEEAARNGEALTRTVQTGFDPESGDPIYEEQAFDMTPLPYIVVVVDEMADLMLVAGKDVEASVQRIAQMARAAGIHLIMATQRPSVDVITGTIKANFPTRVSFQVTSKIDSRTILGEGGAEQLLGQGDMLYMAGGGRLMRVHGPLVTDVEVERVVRALKAQGTPSYVEDVTEDDEPQFPGIGGGDSGTGDELYDQAVALVCRERKASTSFVQRHLQIGYNRAARLIERMEAEGVVSTANHVGKREVLARNIDDRTT